MIKTVVENDKILYEVAPESHAHSYECRRAGEILDVDA
jgi:Fe2+ or Zn2+ uptake regulation protein